MCRRYSAVERMSEIGATLSSASRAASAISLPDRFWP
jgi:hypothetical protein